METAVNAIGGRWKVLALHYLLAETKRFGELHRLAPSISTRTLTRQLRELEEDGIIRRTVHRQIPPKVEYSITPLGKKLRPVLYAMHGWGEEAARFRARNERGPRFASPAALPTGRFRLRLAAQ